MNSSRLHFPGAGEVNGFSRRHGNRAVGGVCNNKGESNAKTIR